MLRRFEVSPVCDRCPVRPWRDRGCRRRKADCRARLRLPSGANSCARDKRCPDQSSRRPRRAWSHAIRAARDDEPVHGFHAPAVRHEFRGEPIEQLRMRRRAPVAAKIRRRGDEAAAEVAQPNVVHRHARGERVSAIWPPSARTRAGDRAASRIVFRRTRFEVGRGRACSFLLGSPAPFRLPSVFFFAASSSLAAFSAFLAALVRRSPGRGFSALMALAASRLCLTSVCALSPDAPSASLRLTASSRCAVDASWRLPSIRRNLSCPRPRSLPRARCQQ